MHVQNRHPRSTIVSAHHEAFTDPFIDNAPNYQVYVLTARRPHAVCRCGWTGHHRFTTAGARVDAWIHAAQDGHTPATPLTRRAAERTARGGSALSVVGASRPAAPTALPPRGAIARPATAG